MSIVVPVLEDRPCEPASPGVLPADPQTPTGPLTQDHLDQLERARQRSTKLRRACRVAAFSGWTTVGLAALALPFALLDLTTLILGLALLAIGINELRSRRMLLRLDPRAPQRLAINQLVLIALIVSYAGWSLYTGLTSTSELSSSLAAEPAMESTLQLIQGMERTLVIAVYTTMIVASIVIQGAAALYYTTRSRHLTNYLDETPDWIKDLQTRAPSL